MVQDVRELNRSLVLTDLLRRRPATRKQIAESIKTSAATVTRVVEDLLAAGMVREVSEVVVEKRGRRAVLLDVVADRALVVGIDLGASSTRIVATDLLGTPIASVQLDTPTELEATPLALWVAEQARSIVGARWEAVAAVSLGLPGAVNQSTGTVSNAPNLVQIEDPTFLEVCGLALGRPFEADNDANHALLGEMRFGAASSTRQAALLNLGAGLGAGIAIDGVIHRGQHGLVGEFGQIPFGASGRRLEDSTTGPGLLRRAAELGIPLSAPSEVFVEANKREMAALRAEFDSALITVLAAISVSCEPETILLGGGIAKSLTDSLGDYQSQLHQVLRVAPQLRPVDLGDFAGAAGAVVTALHSVYSEMGVAGGALGELPNSAALTLESVNSVMRPV